MKLEKNVRFCSAIVFALLIFSACVTSGQKNVDGASYGFEPVPLETVSALERTVGGFKTIELLMYFFPDENLVEVEALQQKRGFYTKLDEQNRKDLFLLAETFFDSSLPAQNEKKYELLLSENGEDLYAGCLNIEGKPYFVLSSEHEIYFTPKQFEFFLARIEPDFLQSITDSLQIDTSGEF